MTDHRSDLGPPLLRLEGLPVLQNRVYPSPEAARSAGRGTLVLQQKDTGIISNVAFDPTLLHYDQDYQNEQACSPAFQQHLDDVLRLLRKHFPAGSSVAEIGCGKGFFLEMLFAAGYEAIGIDPAYEGQRESVIRAPFSRELGISAPGLVMRHVLEHIQDPVAFLEGVAHANGQRGKIYIEVPCLDWILANRAWFDVFYEHVNYFRASDFEAMFGRIHEIGHLFGGQYLSVVADLATLRRPARRPAVTLPPDFMAGIRACADRCARLPRPAAIWGAASKGVLFAHHLSALGISFAGMIDINPVKQGRFAAGTGLPIHAPEAALRALPRDTTAFVMNPNYIDEIRELAGGQFDLVSVDAL